MNDLLGPSASSVHSIFSIVPAQFVPACRDFLSLAAFCFCCMIPESLRREKKKVGYWLTVFLSRVPSSLLWPLVTPTWRRKKDQYKISQLAMSTLYYPLFQCMHYPMRQPIYLISRPHIIISVLEVKDIMDQTSSRKHYTIFSSL